MFILKYSILSMKISEGNIYNLIISAMMHSVLTFSLNNNILEITKLGLVYRPDWKSLSLFNLEPYRFSDRKSDDIPVISEMAKESLLTISSSRLTQDVCAGSNFSIALVNPLESRFIASEGLFDIDHIRRYACAVIELDKEFNFSPAPHQLDTLSPLALATQVVDEIPCCYSCLLLK